MSSLELDLTGYAPCPSKLHHTCVVQGNPEFWPVIGGVVTKLTDFLGDITGLPVMNGYYGFAFLVAIIISIVLLVHKFGKKKLSIIFKKLKKSL